MRWLELSVEADVEAVEAVSEILGRVGGRDTAVQPDAADPRPRRRAGCPRGSGSAVRRDRARRRRRRPRPRRSSRPSARCGTSRRSACGRSARCASARSTTPTGPRPGRRTTSPQRIGRVVIVPSLARRAARGRRGRRSRLDPGMAFGTGLHPTTRGCLELLQELEPMPPASSTSAAARASWRWPPCGSAPSGGRARHRSAGREATLRQRGANGLADRFERRARARCPAIAGRALRARARQPRRRGARRAGATAGGAPRARRHAAGERHHRAASGRGGRPRCGPPAWRSPTGATTASGSRLRLRARGVTLHRFFVAPEDVAGDRFPLPPAIERQVRARPAPPRRRRIVLLTGDGTRGAAAGSSGERLRRRGAPAAAGRAGASADGRAGAAQGRRARGGRSSTATEVGVAAFRLVVTERCVARELSPAQAGAAARRSRARRPSSRSAASSRRSTRRCRCATRSRPGSVLLFERDDGAAAGAQLEPPQRASSSARRVASARPSWRPRSGRRRRWPDLARGSCAPRRSRRPPRP